MNEAVGRKATRAELAALRAEVRRQRSAAEKAEARADAWRKAYALAAPGGLTCAVCGHTIRPKYPTGAWFRVWSHTDIADDEPCRLAAAAAAEEDARAAYVEAIANGELEAKLRQVHRWGLNEVVNREPWHAYLEEPEPSHPAGTLPP